MKIMTMMSGSTYWFACSYWTLPLLGLCCCLCCHGGLAATVSVQQATSVAEQNVESHTETWEPSWGVTGQTNTESPQPTLSQLDGNVDTYNNVTHVTQRSTFTMTSTVSPESPSESDKFRSTTQVDVTLRRDITNVTNSHTETLTSPNVSSPNASSPNMFSDSNVSISNESSTIFFSNPNVTMSNELTTSIVTSTNDDSWLTNSVTSSLTSQVRIDEDDTVTLKPMSELETETQDLGTGTENENISPEVTQASELDVSLGNGVLTSTSAVTKHVTTLLQTLESHSPTEVLTSPLSNIQTSTITGLSTSVAIAMTSRSPGGFHPPMTDIDASSQSTAVPVTMDTNGVTTATDISLAETSSMETTTRAAIVPKVAPPIIVGENEMTTTPSSSASTLLTSRKQTTTISISDKFKKPPKTRLQIKIADNIPTQVAALPTEKPFIKNPIKGPDAPPMKHTTPAISTTTPSPTPWSPTLYVTLVLKTSWGEFCADFQEFQGIIAKLLGIEIQKDVYSTQVKLLETDRCPVRTVRSVRIAVDLYVVNSKGIYDFEMNNVFARLIQVEQIRRLVGSTFEDKILDFKIHGKVDEGRDVASESPDSPQGDMDQGVVIAIGISCLAGLCVIGVVIVQVVYVKRRRGIKRMRKSFRERYSVDVHSIAESIQMGEVYGRRGARFIYDNPALNWCEAKDYTSNVLDMEGLAKMVDNTDAIEDEFLLLPSKMPKLSDVPLGAEDKNRYANVIPNPETRVRLTQRKGEDNSDYINANFLRGYLSSPRGYIATQAPLEGTCADFWRMAWEQRCQIVIMLTGLEEHGLSKCAEYWPNTDGGDVVRIYGDFEITQQRRQVKTEWIMSMITLRYLKTNQCHEVLHFWMTAWPVNGLPDARTVIHFLLALRPHLEETTAPPIIHCSPGTGRTGTLIAIDLGMLSYDDTKMVDVLASVYRMRQDRGGMVQTREQYEYIYRVLCEYVQMVAPDT